MKIDFTNVFLNLIGDFKAYNRMGSKTFDKSIILATWQMCNNGLNSTMYGLFCFSHEMFR